MVSTARKRLDLEASGPRCRPGRCHCAVVDYRWAELCPAKCDDAQEMRGSTEELGEVVEDRGAVGIQQFLGEDDMLAD